MQVKANDRIETFHDLVRVLKTHPEWLEELRQLILTTELIELPKKFEEFIENEFKPLKKKVDKLEEDVAVLKQDVAVLKQDVAVLKQDVAVLKQDVAVLKQDVKILKDDVGMLKGDMFEMKLKDKAPSRFGFIIRRCKVLSAEKYVEILDDALDENKITFEEREDALDVDLVATGVLTKDPTKKVFLVAEASVKADKRDIERAYRRAQIFKKATDTETLAVVVCKEKTQGAIKKAQELDVILINVLR
ncbi:hypothetical protein V4D30_07005 [Thermodesulfovibrio sp. 3907-1M]|uniref:DUF3782 domain-containing protein n=1 Tax=Thermodesulfovibrio autotrophicus TaxID=3118333 RepID=A0AAU8GWV3_9BACT